MQAQRNTYSRCNVGLVTLGALCSGVGRRGFLGNGAGGYFRWREGGQQAEKGRKGKERKGKEEGPSGRLWKNRTECRSGGKGCPIG